MKCAHHCAHQVRRDLIKPGLDPATWRPHRS